MAETYDPETLALRLDGLRLARISNEIEGVREHPEDSPLLDAFARGEIDGEELLNRVNARIESARRKQVYPHQVIPHPTYERLR